MPAAASAEAVESQDKQKAPEQSGAFVFCTVQRFKNQRAAQDLLNGRTWLYYGTGNPISRITRRIGCLIIGT